VFSDDGFGINIYIPKQNGIDAELRAMCAPGGHPNSPTCGHPKLPHLSMLITAER